MSILSDLSPTSLAAKALVGIAVIGAAFAGGYYEGFSREKLVYNDYVVTQKSAAQAQLIANQNALKSQQAAFDAQLKQIHSEYTDNANSLQASRDAALASAASYAGKLRDYLAGSHAQPVVPGSKAGSKGTVDPGEGGLLDGISSLNWYLTQRFGDADDLANRFNYAVQVIAEDRKICNGSLPGVTPQ
jgi:hypothetical protein